MRLVCPNCDAEYEVDAALIPDSGRDVQCSNCGHAWFQSSPTLEAELAAEEALFASASSEGAAQKTIPQEDDDEDLSTPPAAAAVPARGIDASVMSVLRDEAERETRARAAEAGNLETQDELGLAGRAPGVPGANPVADRIARMKGDAEVNTAVVAQGSRGGMAKSGMLPEIETINSTLRAKSERRSGEQSVVADTLSGPEAKKAGFGRGFGLALVLILIGLALYLAAPYLMERFPGSASPLRAYVGYVEGLRGLIDAALQAAIGQIRGLTGGDTAG
jgi:predicted Zn finger-like uncharacterized protein